jgi:hypothetical protein
MRKYPAVEVGARYGRLTVMSEAPKRPSSSGLRRYWKCRCDCGNSTVSSDDNLKGGRSQSCGCGKAEATRQRFSLHGSSSSAEYKLWTGMKRRCLNQNSTDYKNYGARGIGIDPTWAADYAAFRAHVGPRPSPNHSIDRIDVNGNYEPGNVRWCTRAEQKRNQRTNVWVDYKGTRMCMADAAALAGLGVPTVAARRKKGWPEARWFEPARPMQRLKRSRALSG